MQYGSDALVEYLCGKKCKNYRVFRDEYDLRKTVRRWRNFVVREDRFSRYAEMTSHGPFHVEGVATLVTELAGGTSFLTDSEKFLLLAMAYLHDVGTYHTFDPFYKEPMALRHIHGPLTMQSILRQPHLLMPGIAPEVVRLVALLCSYHQGKAALSEEELNARDLKKRMRQPFRENKNGDLIEVTGQSITDLPEQPSLEAKLKACYGRHECFSLRHIDAPLCPFLMGTLIKLLDGCDYQAGRCGSVENLLRHADRNQSHAERSSHIMEHSAPDSDTYKRAEQEKQFFEGSVFHFLRNLLIDRTFILGDLENDRAELVIKPAAPELIRDSIVSVVMPSLDFVGARDKMVGRQKQIVEIVRRYLEDPTQTICEVLKIDPDHGFLAEWRVDVPPDAEGDCQTVHYLVARKYIERELNDVSAALQSPSGNSNYHYCRVCPNSQDCSLKRRKIPSFAVGKPGTEWNVPQFDEQEHLGRLKTLPSLSRLSDKPKVERQYRRPQSERFVRAELENANHLLLYGPRGRGKSMLASMMADNMADGPWPVMWFSVNEERQIEEFVRTFAAFLANNGEFSAENLLRGEDVTTKHEEYILRLLSSGCLASHGKRFMLCVDNYNRLKTTSRTFFKQAIGRFICVNCPGALACEQARQAGLDSPWWHCKEAISRVVVLSSKIPGHDHVMQVGGLPLACIAAPPLEDDEILTVVQRHRSNDMRAIIDAWKDFGSEPVGIDILGRRPGEHWNGMDHTELLVSDFADFFARNFGMSGLGSDQEWHVMRLVALLDGILSRDEVERVLGIPRAEDEGTLQKLIDRDLLRQEGTRLVAHRAWVAGHARTGWLNRAGGHPWPLLLRYIGLGDAPYEGLLRNWEQVSPYLQDLAVLRSVSGGQHHEWDVLEHSLRTLQCLDGLLERLGEVLPDRAEFINKCLDEEISGTHSTWPSMSRRGLLRIAAIFHDVGKRDAFSEQDGKVTFLKHADIGADQWRLIAGRYGMPSAQMKLVEDVIRCHMHAIELLGLADVSDKSLDKLVKKADDRLVEVLLLCWSDWLATGKNDDNEQRIVAFIEHIFKRGDELTISASGVQTRKELAAQGKLITGNDLIAAGMQPGPAFKEALEVANEALRIGECSGKDEALTLAREIYDGNADS